MVHDLFKADAFETVAGILSDRSPEVIVDIGAHIGSTCDRLLAVFPTSRVWAFEPVASTFNRLSMRVGNHPRVDVARLAVGSDNGEIEIYVNGFADTSSALAPTEACRRYHGEKVDPIRNEQVEMVRLDDWAARSGAGDIEVMKVDVQGLELEVLRGAERLLTTTVRAVLSEAQLAPIYQGAATFSEIDLYLRSCGFVLHQVCRIASCGAERRTTCCDALWVREDVHRAYIERVTECAAGVTA